MKQETLVREDEKPLALALSFTHILQLDDVKRPLGLCAIADCFTNTSIGIGFSSLPKKMWVRIRALARGRCHLTDQLTLAGQRVHLSTITIPVMNIAAASDHLIPLQHVKPTLQAVSSSEKELFILPGSHFGLVTGPMAVHALWPRVVNWLAKHSLAEG